MVDGCQPGQEDGQEQKVPGVAPQFLQGEERRYHRGFWVNASIEASAGPPASVPESRGYRSAESPQARMRLGRPARTPAQAAFIPQKPHRDPLDQALGAAHPNSPVGSSRPGFHAVHRAAQRAR